jgi:hypothetical protein
MSSKPWQLDNYQATLSLGQLHGAIDLLLPERGLQLHWRDFAIAALAVGLPSVSGSQASSVLDAWVRGGDLVATYAENANRRTRGQVYWRAHEHVQDNQKFPAIDLIASVQTSLLDSDPALNVRSRVAAREVLLLTDIDSGRAAPLDWGADDTMRLAAPGQIACSIFRLGDGKSSYVEMVHPADFNECVWRRESNGETELSNRLFHGRLEKGVILRSRIRAIFVPTDNDAELASACYAEFATSEPILTV